jgi:hypothetical protein
MAFKKIKTISKTFNSNLVTSPTSLNLKYKKLNQTYLNDNSFLLSNNYGLVRQHNLLSLKSNLVNNNFSLDQKAFETFLERNTTQPTGTLSDGDFFQNLNLLKKSQSKLVNSNFINLNTVSDSGESLNKNIIFLNYQNLLQSLNNDSDKAMLQYPLRKLFNQNLNQFSALNNFFTLNHNNESNLTLSFNNNTLNNQGK